jgi:hypothetical protein
MGRGVVLGGVAVVLTAAGAGGWLAWQRLAPRAVPSGQSPLLALDDASLAALKADFNAGKDKTRVLALLSPT